jgi:hypothetical protein
MLRGNELSAGPSHLISAVRCFTLNLSRLVAEAEDGFRSNVRALLKMKNQCPRATPLQAFEDDPCRNVSITTRRDTARVSFGESGLSMGSEIVPHYGNWLGPRLCVNRC